MSDRACAAANDLPRDRVAPAGSAPDWCPTCTAVVTTNWYRDEDGTDRHFACSTALESRQGEVPGCQASPVPPPPAADGTFGLRTVLGDDETARLIRRQRETARQYFQMDVVARQTAWLVANGYEETTDA